MNANNATQQQQQHQQTVNQHQTHKNCWDHFGRNKVSFCTIHFKYGDWFGFQHSSFSIFKPCWIFSLCHHCQWECESVKIIAWNACIRLTFFSNSYIAMKCDTVFFFDFLLRVDVVERERESEKKKHLKKKRWEFDWTYYIFMHDGWEKSPRYWNLIAIICVREKCLKFKRVRQKNVTK